MGLAHLGRTPCPDGAEAGETGAVRFDALKRHECPRGGAESYRGGFHLVSMGSPMIS